MRSIDLEICCLIRGSTIHALIALAFVGTMRIKLKYHHVHIGFFVTAELKLYCRAYGAL